MVKKIIESIFLESRVVLHMFKIILIFFVFHCLMYYFNYYITKKYKNLINNILKQIKIKYLIIYIFSVITLMY